MLTQEQEDQEYELNARYDYIREVYGEEARLLNQMAEDDARRDREEGLNEYLDACEAACGVPWLTIRWPVWNDPW